MNNRKVVVTGMGMVSPIGNTVAESWSNALEGKSGVALNEYFDTANYPAKICAAPKGFDVSLYMDHKEARRLDVFIQLGMAAGIQAVQDAGLASPDEQDLSRIGVSIGSGIGGLWTIQNTHATLLNKGPKRVSPFFIPSCVINMISGNLSIRYGFRGPNLAVVTACTTGTHNIGLGVRLIQYGDADVMVVGGAESTSCDVAIAGFSNMRALSTRNDDPEAASRPWDDDRDGFVLGEGAGVLVIEEFERAKARDAHIYAEVTGFGMSGDAYHITSPSEEGKGAIEAMQNALNDAQLSSDDIQYINAHGTSTPLGDLSETRAIKKVFGNDTKVAVNSTKSMIGHLLGAAGSVEAIFSIKALEDQISPPTINLHNPSEGCDLDYVANTARDMKIDVALSNSFGFGGTNGTLIFTRA